MIEKLQKRRSIRKYIGEDVSEEKLRCILSAGLLSPTSKNLHPWEFLVVQDKRTLEKLADCRDKGRLCKKAGARESCYRSHRQSRSLGCLDRGLLHCHEQYASYRGGSGSGKLLDSDPEPEQQKRWNDIGSLSERIVFFGREIRGGSYSFTGYSSSGAASPATGRKTVGKSPL